MRSAEVVVGEESGFGCDEKGRNGLGSGGSRGGGCSYFCFCFLKMEKSNHVFMCWQE